ncbi:MAG TPA: DUF4333 domain-containing protein [Actinomycetota bacterium]|nr:DUF4333 domain-containing protein [Actinomycetota bacterium]
MTPSKAAIACALAGSAVFLAGCSFDVSFGSGPDTSEVEAKLVEEQKKVSPDLDVGEATCPEEVEVEEGAKFECTVDIEGVDAPYAVTLTDVNEDEETVNFHSEPVKPIIDVSLVVEFLRGNLNEQSQDAEVDCGDEAVLVTEVGATIECTVSDETDSETVSLVVKNLEGDVGFQQ